MKSQFAIDSATLIYRIFIYQTHSTTDHQKVRKLIGLLWIVTHQKLMLLIKNHHWASYPQTDKSANYSKTWTGYNSTLARLCKISTLFNKTQPTWILQYFPVRVHISHISGLNFFWIHHYCKFILDRNSELWK